MGVEACAWTPNSVQYHTKGLFNFFDNEIFLRIFIDGYKFETLKQRKKKNEQKLLRGRIKN